MDPSGRFSAIALARSLGYSEDEKGVVDMLNNVDRKLSNRTTLAFNQYWGWVKLLLDAQSGDSLMMQEIPFPIKQVGTFECNENKGTVHIVVPVRQEWGMGLPPNGWEKPMVPVDAHAIWRSHGAYALVSKTGNHLYRDSDNNGGFDWPDMFIVTGGYGIGSGGGIIDKYGNRYTFGTAGFGPNMGGYYSEGYLMVNERDGSLVPPYHRYDWPEDLLRSKISGWSLTLSAQSIWGGSLIFAYGGYMFKVYGFGAGVDIGASIGSTWSNWKDMNTAWADKFYYPAPTQSDVWAQAIHSLAQDPCGKCSMNP